MNLPFLNRNPRRWRVLYEREGDKGAYALSNAMNKRAAMDYLDIFNEAVMVVEIKKVKVYNGGVPSKL